jgi:hypothetical protein
MVPQVVSLDISALAQAYQALVGVVNENLSLRQALRELSRSQVAEEPKPEPEPEAASEED